MPGLSGPELAAELRAQHAGLGVIYMSGFTDDAINRRGVMDKAAVILEKPFSSQSLDEKIRQVLRSVPS